MQVILKLKQDPAPADLPDALARLGRRVDVQIAYVRAMSGEAHVVRISGSNGQSEAAALLRLRSDSAVEYADPDGNRRAH